MLKRRVVAALRAFREPPLFDAGHFYSPLLDRAQRTELAARLAAASPPDSLPGIELDLDAQLTLLQKLAAGYADLPWSAHPASPANSARPANSAHPAQGSAAEDAAAPPLRYHYENRNYEYADAIFYALLLRHVRPRRVIEIGSGFSSAVALDVNDLFLDGSMELTFIEPFPDERLLGLAGEAELGARLIRKPLQDVDPTLFAELGENDVLFVDSTHVARADSDVNRLVFEILPSLRPGVLVHVHDIFYPFEYPAAWVRDGRAWNEAYLLRAFLQYNEAFEIVLFNTYLEQARPEWFAEHMPLCLKNPGGSIWLRRR